MPKQRITKEMVVDAAFNIARKSGMEQVLVKNIAGELACSVQPIYSYCTNMEGLRMDVTKKACAFVKEYITKHIDSSDFFKSTGHAYVRLAKEEPHIFQIFVMHRRENIFSLEDLYRREANPGMAEVIAGSLGISEAKAKSLHMNMLIYTVGIGTILATTEKGISSEETEQQLEQAYQAFLRQTLKQEEKEDES